MSRPGAPSLPTPKQVRDLHETVSALHPGARIVRVGPEGVAFDYPDAAARTAAADAWAGKPFSDRT